MRKKFFGLLTISTGMVSELEVYPLNVSSVWSGDTTTIHIISVVSWTITSYSSWIICSKSSGSDDDSFTITTKANAGGERVGYVYVTKVGGGASKTVQVTQAAKP